MKSLVFDSSTIITLAMNNLLSLLKPLKEKFQGEFYIPLSVKEEIIDVPFRSKKFKFEAMQVLKVIEEGHLKIYDDSKLERERKELARLVNGLYRSKKKRLKVLQDGEIGALVLANSLGSSALVVDERTTRMILERPRELAELFKKKMHREVWLDDKALERFLDKYGKVKIIRSVEMGVVAYELGFLDKYIIRKGKKKNELRKDLLDAFLWGFKLRGCAISVDEINSILTIEKV